jgi:hypothetical protein
MDPYEGVEAYLNHDTGREMRSASRSDLFNYGENY